MTQLQQEIWERFLELVAEAEVQVVNAYKMHQNNHQRIAAALRKGRSLDVIC